MMRVLNEHVDAQRLRSQWLKHRNLMYPGLTEELEQLGDFVTPEALENFFKEKGFFVEVHRKFKCDYCKKEYPEVVEILLFHDDEGGSRKNLVNKIRSRVTLCPQCVMHAMILIEP